MRRRNGSSGETSKKRGWSKADKTVADNLKVHLVNFPWTIACPTNASILMNAQLSEDNASFLLATHEVGNNFRVEVPLNWHEVDIGSMSIELASRHPIRNVSPSERVRLFSEWLYRLKYTHPVYRIVQRFERSLCQKQFEDLIARIVGSAQQQPFEGKKVALVGANRCLEVASIVKFGRPRKLFAFDLAPEALAEGKERHPWIDTCVWNIERSLGQMPERLRRKGATKAFDTCFALRTLQGASTDQARAIQNIAEIVKPGGLVVLSVPTKSVNNLWALRNPTATPTMAAQVTFDDLPAGFLESAIKRIVTSLVTCGSFSSLTVELGDGSGPECYIVARRRDN